MSTTGEKEARWYIIHTYSGQEERVKKNLDQRVASMDTWGAFWRLRGEAQGPEPTMGERRFP